MRETFIPLFQDIRNSSVWAYDSDTRIVWLTLLTLVDPEGYVAAAIPGLAIAANVPIDKVRAAMALFESPDPDSRSEEHEGRRVEKVPRGWRILNYAAHIERARHEADKARKRRWAREHRAAVANDDGLQLLRADEFSGIVPMHTGPVDALSTERSETVAAGSETLDASKSKSGSDLTFSSEPLVVFNLDGWAPSEALRAEAIAAGVRDLDARIAELRRGPIGGRRGVFASKRDDYVRGQFGKWKTWGETEAHQAQQARRGPAPAPEPPKRPHVKGLPAWVHPDHEQIAKLHKLDLRREARGFAKGHHIPVDTLRPIDLLQPFREYLLKRSNEEAAA